MANTFRPGDRVAVRTPWQDPESPYQKLDPGFLLEVVTVNSQDHQVTVEDLRSGRQYTLESHLLEPWN